MKLESKYYNLYLDSQEVKKHLEELFMSYDDAKTPEEAQRAAWCYESAKALAEALRKASEELEYLIQEGIVEG